MFKYSTCSRISANMRDPHTRHEDGGVGAFILMAYFGASASENSFCVFQLVFA